MKLNKQLWITVIENASKINKHIVYGEGLIIKGTLMQIWKSPYKFVFILKRYLENFAFLIQRIIELFAREVCKLLKK